MRVAFELHRHMPHYSRSKLPNLTNRKGRKKNSKIPFQIRISSYAQQLLFLVFASLFAGLFVYLLL